MKKIIFSLIFVLFICASVSCVSAAENPNINTYTDSPEDLGELKGQVDNLEDITGQDLLLDDILEFQFMNNAAEYGDDIIVDNYAEHHDAGEIQDVELNKNTSDNVKHIADTHYRKDTFFIIVSMIFNAINFRNFPDFFHFLFVS